MFPDLAVKSVKVDPQNLFKTLNKLDEESAIIFSHFEDGVQAIRKLEGHAFNAVKENGIWRLYDVQNGSEISYKFYHQISKNYTIITTTPKL